MKNLFTPILLSLIINTNVTSNNLEENSFFVNLNNVNISEKNYEKLLQLGYTNREIEKLTYEEYDEISDLTVYNTYSYSYVSKTIYEIQEEDINLISEEKMNENDAIDEINNINNNISTRSVGNASANYDDDYKKITLTGSVTSGSSPIRHFYIKLNVEWLTSPVYRGQDFVSLNIDDDIQILYETVDGNQRPDFISKFMYTTTETFYQSNFISDPIQSVNTEENSIIINGGNTGLYKYGIDEGLTVEYNLPADVVDNQSGLGYYSEYRRYHSNMFITVSANFQSQIKNLDAVTFGGGYAHNTVVTTFNIDDVHLSMSSPYITFGSSLTVTDGYQTEGLLIFFDEEDFVWPTC